jgi:protein gp37
MKKMNKTNDNIGWAQYSWNPVTGCNFACEYCYAKEITDRYFGGDFTPKFHEDRLDMPANTKPGANDNNNRVFVCSMGELFGDWVPQEWIDKVLSVCRSNPQWTFLFLTKNPSRLPTIDFPANSWVGTTVDCQKRVKGAYDAFSKMPVETKLFISSEPLTEPLELPAEMWERLNLVIVGALSKGATKVQPEAEWVESILMGARKWKTKVWFKDNLVFRPQETI